MTTSENPDATHGDGPRGLPGALSAIDRLLIEHACRGLVHRAAAFTDAAAPDRFAALFTADAQLLRPNGNTLIGAAAIEASYRARPLDRITRHLVTTTVVDVESPAAARATSAVLLWSGSATDSHGPFGRPAQPRQVIGEFDDCFVLTAQGWRIARREARFLLFSGSPG